MHRLLSGLRQMISGSSCMTFNLHNFERMKKSAIPILSGLILCSATACAASQAPETGMLPARKINARNLIQYANPMCGTGGNANVFPGAVAPFGMIQWSPDTELGLHKCGYFDGDARISDFSLDHMSGAGAAMAKILRSCRFSATNRPRHRSGVMLLPSRSRIKMKLPVLVTIQ